MYHLQRWQHGSDQILADLCRRFINRDLLKALDVTELSTEAQQWLVKQAYPWLVQANLEPSYYLGVRIARSRGYTLYQRGIKLQTDFGLQEISQVSALVQTLTRAHERVWLIYPREIEPQLQKARQQG
jgi:hypothetical protein